MIRRDVLAGLLTLAALPARGQDAPGVQLGTAAPFQPADLRDMARALATRRYTAPRKVPKAWIAIDYDTYRSIWFDSRMALWQAEGNAPFRVDLFAPGLFYPAPVRIDVVEGGAARPILFDIGHFDRTDTFPDLPVDDSLGYSGFRLRAELETPGIFTEFAVFQGASYFRGIGTGQIYGLSARGLAIDTAEPTGEEFPEFRRFWIERPLPDAPDLVIHALLDGPGCTGAYRFRIRPGARLVIAVEAEIFARRPLRHIGVAPLTSMFQFDETNRDRFSDFRPAVHDSDGLLVHNGAGETLWRPLANPRSLQSSAFEDRDPRGFGLMQRAQDFEDFADLEALYHRRPSLWVAPRGSWGKGAVVLVEIPTDTEVADNIVAYWRPAEPVAAGASLAFAYDMTWSPALPHGAGLQVINTRAGRGQSDGIVFAIDYAPGSTLSADLTQVVGAVFASAGTVRSTILQRNPATGGPRMTFVLRPGTARSIELRAELQFLDGTMLGEVWLYRWTV
jgi:glucans biosynthesis protein